MATYLVEGSFLPSNTASIHLNSVPFFKIKPVCIVFIMGKKKHVSENKTWHKKWLGKSLSVQVSRQQIRGKVLVHADYANRSGGPDFVKHADVILER